jgi:hypothetical protein
LSTAELHGKDDATKAAPGGFKGLPESVKSLQRVAGRGRRGLPDGLPGSR